MRGNINKLITEFIGTFTLVLFGCGAAVIAGMGSGATSIDVLGISFAIGLAIVAIAYGIGPVSGYHVNPAVSFGVLMAGRMSVSDFIGYAIAQILGALAGAAILYLILSGRASGWTGGLGQNGWGPGAVHRAYNRRHGRKCQRSLPTLAVHRLPAGRCRHCRADVQVRRSCRK